MKNIIFAMCIGAIMSLCYTPGFSSGVDNDVFLVVFEDGTSVQDLAVQPMYIESTLGFGHAFMVDVPQVPFLLNEFSECSTGNISRSLGYRPVVQARPPTMNRLS